MALATLREVLEIAGRTNTAIPGFNIDNIEIPEAIMEAAEEENCPVILTIGQGAIHAGGLRHLPDVVRRIGESSSVPVVMHLDHGISYEQAVVCLRAGFTSVMYDGSHHPFEENVRESRAVVRAAHAAGISVECELGAISGVEDGMSHSGANLVDLEEVKRFLEAVDCDALAIGIGNAHGIYRGTPDLDFARLAACRDLGAPPLVLHGGSGIPKDMIQKAVRLGIRKINVATEVRLAFMEGLESAVGTRDIYAMYGAAKSAVRALAREKIRMFQNKE